MRLTPDQITAIRTAVLERDDQARVILFGSRVNDGAKGGDIDLLIISDRLTFADEWPIRRELLDLIGWQKLDMIVRKSDHLDDAIARHAMEKGVAL